MDWEGAFNYVIDRCWQTSEDKGWHEDEKHAKTINDHLYDVIQLVEVEMGGRGKPIVEALKFVQKTFFSHGGTQVMQKLMLIVTEVAEAAEDYRKQGIPLTELYYEETEFFEGRPYGLKRVPMTLEAARAGKKPCGFPSEAADIVIRTFDLSKSLKVDLPFAIKCKMAFNETREFKHGGKTC